MKIFTFFCIQDNNIPLNFTIEYTSMSNARLRYSALKSQYKKFLQEGSHKVFHKKVFDYLETDHTFFVIDKFRADTLEDAQEIQRRLTDERKVQMLKCDQKARVPGLITWD